MSFKILAAGPLAPAGITHEIVVIPAQGAIKIVASCKSLVAAQAVLAGLNGWVA
jgi:hypothetical protein